MSTVVESRTKQTKYHPTTKFRCYALDFAGVSDYVYGYLRHKFFIIELSVQFWNDNWVVRFVPLVNANVILKGTFCN